MTKLQWRRNCSAQVVLLALSLWLSGCVNLLVRSPATSNHAFVAYWPPPKDGTGLRLAVKDLIDLKGTITTGGSKYLARNGQPAQTDAACLAIARERNVIIVGKTNLSEFAVAPSGFSAVSRKPLGRQIRIGRLYLAGTDHRVDQAIDAALAAAQFQVITLNGSLRAAWEQAKKDGNTIAAAGEWVNNGKYLGKPGVSSKTAAILALGEYEYKVNYPAALRRRLAWQAELEKIFKTVDFIAIPTLQTLTPASPPLGSTAVFEAQMLSIQNTVPVNLAGNPALAVPIPIEDRAVPLTSLELIGPPLSEAGLLNAGRLLELSVNSSIDRPLVSKSSKP